MKKPQRITGSILAVVFATTSALPAAGIPQIKAPPTVKAPPPVVAPPKVPSAPKVPVVKAPSVPKVPVVKVPSVPKVPVTPKVPAVKVPATPKIPAVRVPTVKVPATPKVPAVKVPATPRIVKTDAAPKVPSVKAPATGVLPRPAKPLITSQSPKLTQPAVVRSAVTTKPSPVKTNPNGGGDTLASITSAPPPETRSTIQGGNGSQSESSTEKSKKKGRDYSDIENAYRRQKESEDADGGAGDPYVKNGGFDREQFQRDERLIAAFENEQTGAGQLLEDSKKPADPQAPATPDDDAPVAVTRGRIKDLVKVEGAAQIVGLKGDEPELVDAKDQIARGKVRDPKAVERIVDRVANKGVDQQFGEAPEVNINELIQKGDALKDRKKFKEAADLYNQAEDALRNGGKNSAGYRLGIIADVSSGKRPAKDMNRVVAPVQGAAKGAAANPSPAKDAPKTAPAGSGGESLAQRGNDTRTAIQPGGGTPAPAVETGNDPANQPAPGNGGGQPPAAAEAAGPDNNMAQPIYIGEGTLQNGEHNGEQAVLYQDPVTGGYFAVTADGTVVPIGFVNDADGKPADVGVVPSPGSGGETVVTAEAGEGSPPEGGGGGANNGNNNGEGGNNDGDKKDDDNNNENQNPPPADADAPDAPAENNDDTAEASTEGTPNPEAAERGGRSGRLAEATQGRLGGDEQRRQNNAIDQRKNGNGAGDPNPEGNTSSGVLLTKEEQSAFAKNLGMKRGGGVTTPSENESSTAVTDRDLKDIAARRGSTIDPASGSDGKGGSGQTLGKNGFTPGAPAPSPAPKGVQVNNAVQAAPAASAVNGSAVRVDSAKVKAAAR
ncbi:MAG: hypothetical protein R3F13_01885 [Prosthecobacter sp.]